MLFILKRMRAGLGKNYRQALHSSQVALEYISVFISKPEVFFHSYCVMNLVTQPPLTLNKTMVVVTSVLLATLPTCINVFAI